MHKIIFNCYSTYIGGGITVARSLIDEMVLSSSIHELQFLVLCSSRSIKYFDDLSCYPNVSVLQSNYNTTPFILGSFLSLYIELPLLFFYNRRLKPVLINFGDLPALFIIRQIFYFDWPFGICEWHLLFSLSHQNLSVLCYRVLKRLALAISLSVSRKNSLVVTTQTYYIKNRLKNLYGIQPQKVFVFPNPAAPINDTAIGTRNTSHEKFYSQPRILLCLSAYYIHKNLPVLLEVARLLSRISNEYLIVTTFFANSSQLARRLHDEISFTPGICNIGPISQQDLCLIYRSASASILPTLLESYSGVYQESFSSGTPVLTSDLPFAKEVCDDGAIYFDPHSANSIVRAVMSLFSSYSVYQGYVQKGFQINQQISTWESVASSFLKLPMSSFFA